MSTHNLSSMKIHIEEPGDHAAVYSVNVSAFGTPDEADLVEVLRREADPIISLVAEENETVVGHILFSPATMVKHTHLKVMGLGPMAVLPGFQGKGIGTALVESGLEHCKQLGFGAVVVLGHAWFYPRFGFIPAVRYGITSEYEAPAEAFMVLELSPSYLHNAQGLVKYHPAFNEV